VVPRRPAALLALLIGCVALAAISGAASPAAAQTNGERVAVAPGEGTLQTRFRFTGSGYQPGRSVTIRVTPPDNVERRIRGEDGVELVWVTAADGSFQLDLVPGDRFPGTPGGRWRVLFCTAGASTCQQVEIDIAR
jgi:hypothetical protein